jgi:hypothetical protein
MTIDPGQLLKRLEPAVRPAAAPSTGRAASTPLERQEFDELLTLVASGSLHSDRVVTIDANAELDDELDEGQMKRLAAAADVAEASGARGAVMLIDGRGIVMDVPQRAVTGELSASSSTRLIEIDAAVYVAGDDEEEAAGQVPLGTGSIPPAVARQLEQLHRASSRGGEAPVPEEQRGPHRAA